MGLTYKVPVDLHECNYPNGSFERPLIMVGEGSLWECDGCGKEWIYEGSAIWSPTVQAIEAELK